MSKVVAAVKGLDALTVDVHAPVPTISAAKPETTPILDVLKYLAVLHANGVLVLTPRVPDINQGIALTPLRSRLGVHD